MRGYTILDTAYTPDNVELTLCERGPEVVIRAHNIDLMSNRMHGSEEVMAELVRSETRGAKVLVGGLGMGYTLRAALDQLPQDGEVTVCELMNAVVDWNRTRLGYLADYPLEDRRTTLVVADVADLLIETPETWDCILLDVDNGPQSFTQKKNSNLYVERGLNITRMALRVGGAVAFWSAFEDPQFERRFKKTGFSVEAHQVRARGVDRGPWHWIYVGRR